MELLTRLMAGDNGIRRVPDESRAEVRQQLSTLANLDVYSESVVSEGSVLYFLGRRDGKKHLGVLAQQEAGVAPFEGETTSVLVGGGTATLKVGPTSHHNAVALRGILGFLNPQPLGLRKSAGLGDRLGLATPGHLRALRAEADAGMLPILAQQSIRENARTGRTPMDVLDDAMWGTFQMGWEEPWGADADHLKTFDDVDSTTAAGYTFYTIDPGEHVDDRAASLEGSALQAALEALPWHALESSPADLLKRLGDQELALDGGSIRLPREEVMRAAVKYGRAVAHTATMSRRIKERLGATPFDLEVSVDETEQVTSLVEHIYIANELKRLGVEWVSMAPRYVGRFEKGVDYIGDLDQFEREFTEHVRIAKHFGPYKLSLHSGSDKFSIYPIASKVAGELVHLKTAGTSYLEALRAISRADADLFRRILDFAMERYETDRATYLVSGEVAKVEQALKENDSDLARMLDNFDARQVFHVTYGSVLANESLRTPFFEVLRANEEIYDEVVEAHFRRHFRPFAPVR